MRWLYRLIVTLVDTRRYSEVSIDYNVKRVKLSLTWRRDVCMCVCVDELSDAAAAADDDDDEYLDNDDPINSERWQLS